LHGAHRRLDIGLARQQDDGGTLGAYPLQYLESGGVGKVQIEDDDIGMFLLERFDSAGARRFAAT